MADKTYDLVVIGGGPGGYVAAIRAAQLGMSVACVDKRGSLGGTCLNVGCIPSKALLQSSHHFEVAGHDFADHGVKTGKLSLDLKVMMARKNKLVDDLTKGIEFLFKKNKVTYVVGAGTITGPGEVTVSGSGKQVLKGKNILIATGSESAPLPGVNVDEKKIVTSTGALSLDKVPGKLVVIGAGVIGLELGSVWRRLGAEVTVVEFLDQILPGMDADVVKQMTKTLRKQGITLQLSSKVTGAKNTKTGVCLSFEPVAGGKAVSLDCDVVLLAIGRRPFSQGLGLEKVGVEMERGFIKVDAGFRTNVDGIYAIGDVVGGLMLAHKAEEEGIAAVENMAGQSGHVNYSVIPGVVYTWPEVASVGKTEDSLKKDGVKYKAGSFPFIANSRGRAIGETEGFVKVLADAVSDKVLGVHIIGPLAGDLISEAVAVMEFGGSAEDIARTCHAHPGLGEALKEAALAVAGRAIHI